MPTIRKIGVLTGGGIAWPLFFVPDPLIASCSGQSRPSIRESRR